MTTLQIGGEREGITVSIPRPTPRTDRSEGWLGAEIHVHIGAWTGGYAAQFHEWDLVTFSEQLEALSTKLSGVAELSSVDGYLDVTLSGDGLGHITVSGTAWERPRFGTHLEFSFEIDQTDLPALADSVAAVLGELGTPGPP